VGTGSRRPNITRGVCEVKGESYEKELIRLGFLPRPAEILGKIEHFSATCREKANRDLPASSLRVWPSFPAAAGFSRTNQTW